ncbi:MAG: hypothetical protein JST53_01620 [Actinobacteria bacterium]|nr:hypothetical protein [Actinomycetota bacterium]
MTTFLLVCAGCAMVLAALSIRAAEGDKIVQIVFTSAVAFLMAAAFLLLLIQLLLLSHQSFDCEHTLGWWSRQHAGGDVLAALGASSSVLGFWLSLKERYFAALVGGLATIAFAVGWLFAIQGLTLC